MDNIEQETELFSNAELFNKNIAAAVKARIKHLEPLKDTLDNIRVAAEVGSATLPPWPRNNIYVCMDAVISLYSKLLEMGAISPTNNQTQSVLDNNNAPTQEDEMIENIVYDPSLMCALAPWDKIRTVIQVKPSAKEILERESNILDVESRFLANFPQWSMCLNLVDHNLIWNERKVAGIIFARYFITHDPTQTQVDQSCNLAGEPTAMANNIISVIAFSDGSFDLGPFLHLTNTMSVEKTFDHIKEELINNIKQSHSGDESEESKAMMNKIIEDSTSTMDRSREFFIYLIYALRHINDTTDERGELCLMPNNPSVTPTKNGPRIFGADRTRVFYIN